MTGKRRTKRRTFGSVEQLPSGQYRARYRGPDGLRYTAPVTFDTIGHADAWLATVRADVIREAWKAPTDVRTTLAEYGRAWIEQHKGLRPSTRTRYRRLFANHIEPQLGGLPLDRITLDKVREWHLEVGERLRKQVAARRASVKSPTQATQQTGEATQAMTYKLLRAMLQSAVDDELIERNPCRLRGAAVSPTRERPVLSVAEVEQLAEAVPAHHRALVYVLAYTALRPGEACQLRTRDVDLERGVLHVSRSITRSSGQYFEGPPKSQAGIRTVSMPPFVVDILREHMRGRDVIGPDALVFTSRSNGQAYNAAQKAITAGLRAIGRPDARLYDLRHTGQVLAAQSGATPAELRQRMGHASWAAATNYMHTTAEHDRAVAERMGQKRANVIDLDSRRAAQA